MKRQKYRGFIRCILLAALLCDGLKSYGVLRDPAECVIKDINTASPAEVNFFHLNTV